MKRIAMVLLPALSSPSPGAQAATSSEASIKFVIAGGNANKEIAGRLSIAEETVKSHVTNILAKLGANDRTHAVTIGLKRGIIEL